MEFRQIGKSEPDGYVVGLSLNLLNSPSEFMKNKKFAQLPPAPTIQRNKVG